ncbi:MAG: hypothetical protein AB8B99_19580 [Phormidesmis sp.]
MGEVKYFKRLLITVAALFVVCTTLLPAAAIADESPIVADSCTIITGKPGLDIVSPDVVKITPPSVEISSSGGCSFSTRSISALDVNRRVDSAIINLPAGETGTVKKLSITQIVDGNSKLLYGCSNLTVKNGTDLNVVCGGAAYLPEKSTLLYSADLTAFTPGIDFSVTLTASKSSV